MGVWVHGGRSTRAWLLSSFLLFRSRYVRYFMIISCMCFKCFMTSQEGAFLSFSTASSDCLCMAPRTHAGQY